MKNHASFVIRNARLLYPDGQLRPGQLAVRDGRIESVQEGDAPAEAREVFDAGGSILCPGFIDVHLQGLFDHDVWDEDGTGIAGMCRKAPEFGTTAFLATTEYTPESIERVMRGFRRAQHQDEGARVLGLHLEGPYLNPEFSGALPHYSRPEPTPEALERILEQCGGELRLMTIAPEMPGHLALIPHLVRSGVVASLGHCGADYEQAIAGIDAGIRHATHLFNAMPPLHHRRPGAIGAALERPEVQAEIICDTIHIHPAMVRLAYRLKGASGLMLITDAVRVAGLPDGVYRTLGHGQILRKQDGAVRLEDGTLAGSCLTTSQALQNAVQQCGVPVGDALVMLTRTPAEVLGLTGERGVLEAGRLADLVLLDEGLEPARVWIEGRLVFEKPGVP